MPELQAVAPSVGAGLPEGSAASTEQAAPISGDGFAAVFAAIREALLAQYFGDAAPLAAAEALPPEEADSEEEPGEAVPGEVTSFDSLLAMVPVGTGGESNAEAQEVPGVSEVPETPLVNPEPWVEGLLLMPSQAEAVLAAVAPKVPVDGSPELAMAQRLAGPQAVSDKVMEETEAGKPARGVAEKGEAPVSPRSLAQQWVRPALSEAQQGFQVEKPAAPEGPQTRHQLDTFEVHTVRNVRYLISQGGKTMTVRLVPESLGEMRIEVHAQGDELSVRLISANPAVRDIIESQLPGLREALARGGIDALKVEVGAQGFGAKQGQDAPEQPHHVARHGGSKLVPAPGTHEEAARVQEEGLNVFV